MVVDAALKTRQNGATLAKVFLLSAFVLIEIVGPSFILTIEIYPSFRRRPLASARLWTRRRSKWSKGCQVSNSESYKLLNSFGVFSGNAQGLVLVIGIESMNHPRLARAFEPFRSDGTAGKAAIGSVRRELFRSHLRFFV